MQFHWAILNPKRWCCESATLIIPENLENSAVATGLEKVHFHSSPKEEQCQRMFKLLHSFHMEARQCSNFSKLGFNSTWTENFQMYKLNLEKAEEPEIKLPTSTGSQKKPESSRKTSEWLTTATTCSHSSHDQEVFLNSRDRDSRGVLPLTVPSHLSFLTY